MSMAITTAYHGPTHTRGSRIKATARKAEQWGEHRLPEMSITDSYNDAQNSEENHCRVAHLCAAKYKWSGVYVMGDLPGNQRVYVNVCRPDFAAIIMEQLKKAGKIEGRDFFFQPTTER
jgi:hypothetical protein